MKKTRLLLLLVLLMTAATGAWAQDTYKVSMKSGVKDADKWTISPNPAEEGQTVTLQYTGRLKVKGVTATSEATPAAPTGKTVDLSTLTADYEAQDGETLTGTLAGNYKISIADGATVTLDGVTINGVNDGNYEWAGITCLGDATIILSGTNTVKGFYEDYPGIQAAADKTLIINGTGSLTASSYDYAAAIGGGNGVACGNIEIQGGTITATSGGLGAGIGGGYNASCGNITISGGTVNAEGGNNCAGIGGGYNASWGNITISGGAVTATGGQYGAGIGGGKRGPASFPCGNIIISGGTVTATGGENAAGIGGGRGNNNKNFGSCGTITITTGVTKVTATMGDGAANSIGAGKFCNCGTVTIGGVEGAITASPYTYDPTAAAKPALSITSPSVGQVIGSDGKNYAYGSLPSGVTAVAKICYVSGSNGLAMALTDEGKMGWSTAQTACAAHTAPFTGGTWKLATKDEWDNMINAAGSYSALHDGFSSVGGTNMQEDFYWSSTEYDSDFAWYYDGYNEEDWDNGDKIYDLYVRACLAFTAEQSAKPAATVTTAPTGAEIVGVGKTTALVSGGVADGGTLMYAVTTTNTMPTSTAGFSDAVPTAQSIKASGKVYVWYYVKGDDTHSDSEIAATAIEVPVAIIWDVTNVSNLMLFGTSEYEKEGVKLSGNADQIQALCNNYGDPEMDGIVFQTMESGGYIFTAPAGKAFTKIEMKAVDPNGWGEASEFEKLGTGWAFDWVYAIVTWKGTAAASTVGLLTGADNFHGTPISYIAFYLSE